MTNTTKITIPLAPRTKKNGMRILKTRDGRPFLVPSKAYKQYESDCKRIIKNASEPIAEPANVKMIFYMDTRRRVDLVNLQEACLDILVNCGVLLDDNSKIVQSMDGSIVEYDKDNPRTEITIDILKNA